MIEIRAYIFKRRFFWIGWLLGKHDPVMLYADNNPYMSIGPNMEVEYVTFGLSYKSVYNRLTKRAKKLKKEYHNG